jgi:RHS repeat-associated protein
MSAITTYASAPTATTSYSYDARGNLASVTIDGTTVSYSSDGNGLRQSRTVGAVTKQFVWDPNRSIPLLLDDGDHSYIYATGTTPIAQIDDVTGAIEYLHADNIGSVRTVTDSAGTVVSTSDYTPYGAVDSHLGASSSAFGFASAWTDPASGTDYLRAREYEPVTGQFLQVDPAVNVTHEPYAYVAGDPLASVDPLGLCKGMDGTPQDRVCTANDFFWAGLPGVVSNSVKPTFAGLTAGSTFGIGLLTNNDQACYGSDPWFWISYGLGVAGSAVGIAAGGEALVGAKAVEGYSGASAANTAPRFVATADGTIIDTQAPYANLGGDLPPQPIGYYTESGVWPGAPGTERIVIGQ